MIYCQNVSDPAVQLPVVSAEMWCIGKWDSGKQELLNINFSRNYFRDGSTSCVMKNLSNYAASPISNNIKYRGISDLACNSQAENVPASFC